ncbi:DUF2326 domain-containing protein [Arsenicibacter rosenii]|uniref:DUF2326 domain-containing protein n=1 Tax=Arsenicibacter rosenii TaxID=1750698 RepID=A0A1S2VEA9_9BACT|nr:DUF2326 domain-containing protein [Arsenicibacter rosenii]OIN56615.1 hypothetical protein BLX24_23580 [Arsenicibacter rosenii]
MKLNRIYANKNFKPVKFNPGFNVVLAKVSKKLDRNKDSHNLGKSTLISVIDFLLLKKITKKESIFLKYDHFKEHVFFLEIELNSGFYLTIRRSVADHNRIAFKRSLSSQNFQDELFWDYTDIPLSRAKKILDDSLQFDVLVNWDYRKSLTYFLRSQRDYHDVFRLNKFLKGKDAEWKPLIFELLGFNGNALKERYAYYEQKQNIDNLVISINKELSFRSGEADRIRGVIQLRKDEYQELQAQVDEFNFYNSDRKYNEELVNRIEEEVTKLNQEEYEITYQIKKIEDSLEKKLTFDLDSVNKIFKEVSILLPDMLVRKYEELVEFNKSITKERSKYLIDQLNNFKTRLKEVRLKLTELNTRRSSILSVLSSEDSFYKFKQYQIGLSRLEGEISRLEEQLKNLKNIDVLSSKSVVLSDKVHEKEKEVQAQLDESPSRYTDIRKYFNSTFKSIFSVPALIFIKMNNVGNVEFEAEVSKRNELEVTAEGQGFTYEKLLCICFDIAILIAYSSNSFFKFVYHDGALEGLDNRKRLNYLETVQQYCKEFNIQYIFSAIEEDIPSQILDGLNKEEICVELDDTGDHGKLFEFSF